MKFSIWIDEYGTFGMNQEQEYEYAESFFQRAFPEKQFNFKREVTPLNFTKCDVYLIDIGGIGLKNESQMSANIHHIHRLVEDNPSTLFILWSFSTNEWYDARFEGERPHNLFNATDCRDLKKLLEAIENYM